MLNSNIIDYLDRKSKEVRLGILDTIGIEKRGHIGGSLSVADIITALYFYKANHDPKNPNKPDRDRIIMSKGHSVLAQYAALAISGYFSKSELKKTKELGALLQGHPEIRTPGIEANTGSLGQGLSIGVGFALAGKIKNLKYKVYVITGDGELAEGQIWEAVTTASFYKLDNLTIIVDHNKLQVTGYIKERYDLGNLKEKFKSFGCEVLEINGHDFKEIIQALDFPNSIYAKPRVIIANTIKGKGIKIAENNVQFHCNSLNKEEYEVAKKDILSY